MAELFETGRMRFVEAAQADIPFILAMEQAPDNRNFIWQGTAEQHQNEIADPNHLLVVFIEKESGSRVGYALVGLDPKSDVFELRRIAIEQKGRGLGREAMLGFLRYAFEERCANRFWLDVYPDNAVGIRLYESLGMHRDGVLRQSYKSERGYLDQIVYSVLRGEYFSGR